MKEENGTPVGMPAKVRTEEELRMAAKSMEWFTNNIINYFVARGGVEPPTFGL
jgi:hypothetical protein